MLNFHYQNLNDYIPKRHWLHGRCWFNNYLEVEWCLPDLSTFGFKVDVGNGDRLTASVHTLLGSVYTSFESIKLISFLKNIGIYERKIGINYFDEAIWIYLWARQNSWDSRDPKWWSFNIRPLDILFGKHEYYTEVIDERILEIPMPEKYYKANVKLCYDTWIRSKAKWISKKISYVTIDMIDPIPYNGDFTCGFGTKALSIAEGVGIFVGDMLKTRLKSGGWQDWNFSARNMSEALE